MLPTYYFTFNPDFQHFNMIIPRVLSRSAFVLTLFLSIQVMAQKTSIYNDPQASYDQAVDLYNKAKYGSAQVMFDQLATGESSNIKAGSEYYAAMCASQLFHPDASRRFENFIVTYPQNAQVNDANFELGKLQLNSKDYRKALERFTVILAIELEFG